MGITGDNFWLFIIIWILGILIGYLFGRIFHKDNPDGMIFVETVEDSDRERIRFVLDMDLDEIKKQHRLIFRVENDTSQNSQIV